RHASRLSGLDPPEATPLLSGAGAPDVDLPTERAAEMGGMKAGVLMLVGVAAVNVGNYVFHLVAARDLGPSDYGDLVALLTLSALLGLPLAALQVVVGRVVAHLTALGRHHEVHVLNRRAAVVTAGFALAATLVLVVLTPLLQRVLSISSATAVVLMAALTVPAALTPIVWGVAQGLQRFTLLAASMAGGTAIRMLASLTLPSVLLRSWFRRDAPDAGGEARPRLLTGFAPAAVALLAFTSLTQSDVLAANATFSDTASGIYGAASLIGRVILYLPTAIVAVLLPKVAARAAANRSTRDILGLSLLITLLFCVAAAVIYAAAPDLIVRIAFGSKYDGAASLLVPFAVAMTILALLNVLLYYHLGRGEGLFSWVLGCGAVAQIVAFALFHQSPRWLIGDTIAVAFLVLVAHESVTQQTLVRSLAGAARAVAGRRP